MNIFLASSFKTIIMRRTGLQCIRCRRNPLHFTIINKTILYETQHKLFNRLGFFIKNLQKHERVVTINMIVY